MFSDLQKYSKLSDSNLEEYLRRIQQVYADRDLQAPEASVVAAGGVYLEQTQLLAKRFNVALLRQVIVVGIGGSHLGTKAIYDALAVETRSNVDLLFAEALSARGLGRIEKVIEEAVQSDEIVLTIISKSGSTSETAFYAEYVYGLLIKKWGDSAASRVVVITDEGSALEVSAAQLGASVLTLAPAIGGRFSVFTSVGLFPLVLAGVDVEGLLQGAASLVEMDVQNHPSLLSARAIFDAYKNGVQVHNSFFFHPELESLGKWYRQLMGESLGKKFDLNGNEVRIGITPIVSVGSSDLHSMAQLYFGGPKNKYTELFFSEREAGSIVLEQAHFKVNKMIVQKSMAQVSAAIYAGTKHAYASNELLFTEFLLPDFSANTLGKYLQWKMIEIMLLAKALNVNAFDQPNVEDYKQETKRLLDS